MTSTERCTGDVEQLEGHPLGDQETFTVAQAADAVCEFVYEYDFGDSWRHDIVIGQTMPSVGIGTPHLIDGARACPPEDCGGSGGYEHLLEVLADPSDEEHARCLSGRAAPTIPTPSTGPNSTRHSSSMTDTPVSGVDDHRFLRAYRPQAACSCGWMTD